MTNDSAIIKFANDALEIPSDFAYFGDLHQEDGWGRTFSQHRDSDTLERSNWQVITKDLTTRFPDDTAIESYNHWAVGWLETLRVKVLLNPNDSDPITEDNLTPAFHAVAEWLTDLDIYPVADESHWSELEYDEFIEYISAEVPRIWNHDHDEDMPEHLTHSVYEIVSEQSCNADDLRYEDLESAVEEAWIAGLLEDATALHPNQQRMEAT